MNGENVKRPIAWELFRAAADLFFENPGRAAIIGGAFFVAFVILAQLQQSHRRVRAWPFLVVAVLWGLYAIWEWYRQAMEWNIRVDLLLIYSALLAASIAACLLGYRWTRPPE